MTHKRAVLNAAASIAATIIIVICYCAVNISVEDGNVVMEEDSVSHYDDVVDRLARLDRVCAKYSDQFRPESQSLLAPARSFGTEVVYLFGSSSVSSVCIPHKVGSHSWGRFARSLSASPPPDDFEALRWEEKLERVGVRAVVVRHPMERLVSVYRMIFKDWCDRDRFLAKQWDNVCSVEYLKKKSKSIIGEVKSVSGGQFGNLLSVVMEEKLHGRDNFILAIWKKFHPGEELTNPESQLRFTFPEFVRLLVNGSVEFGPEVMSDKGISYHWAPFWRECALCDPRARPNHVLRMETFSRDLDALLEKLPGLRGAAFPHTHGQSGGHSSSPALQRELFSTLTRAQVWELYEKYRVDHEMFGYDVEKYLNYAK
jgi:hypothetical protein